MGFRGNPPQYLEHCILLCSILQGSDSLMQVGPSLYMFQDTTQMRCIKESLWYPETYIEMVQHTQRHTPRKCSHVSVQVSIALNVDVDGGRSSEWDSF